MKSENMKKIYLKPEIVETQIELQQMIATSLDPEGQNQFPSGYGENGEEADSRIYDDWD